jgi:hypothetical protein
MLRHDRELRRLENAIAAIEQSPVSDKLRRHCLLTALAAEHDEQLRVLGRTRATARRPAGA